MQFLEAASVLATAAATALAFSVGACGGSGSDEQVVNPHDPVANPDGPVANPWMLSGIVAEQQAAATDSAKEAIANRRAKLLLAAMTTEQKLQQLTGSMPEILPELPHCYGARHVSGIEALNIPTFRITNGPVGVGQNDCVSTSVYDAVVAGRARFTAAYSNPSSAKATALPSAMGVAASFDPSVASAVGAVIGTEMNNLALHVLEAPGVNLARLPILGRNFEYFGEDPFLNRHDGSGRDSGGPGQGCDWNGQALRRQRAGNEPDHDPGNGRSTGAARAVPSSVRDGRERRQSGIDHVRVQLRQRRLFM